MKIYNKTKQEILTNPDMQEGYLIEDKIIVNVIPAQEEVQEQSHYEFKEYLNEEGEVYGRSKIKVIDVEYKPAQEEQVEYEDILVYVPFSDEDATEYLRELRKRECFEVVNRGLLWYNILTGEQYSQLEKWYKDWLDITITRKIPTKPSWLEV